MSTRDDGPLGFGGDGEEERPPRPERDLRHREDPDLQHLPPREPKPRLGASTIGALALLGFVLFVSASILLGGRDDEAGGARGPAIGTKAPVFSAPLANGPTKEDFNVNVLEERTDDFPAACTVRTPNAVNGCDLFAKGPTAVVFFASGSGRCVEQVDLVERLRGDYRDVSFVAVSLGDERSKTRELQADRGWGMAVAYDLEGLLGTKYGVAVCPQVTFVRKGGEVAGTDVGELDEAGWRAALDALRAGRPIPGAA